MRGIAASPEIGLQPFGPLQLAKMSSAESMIVVCMQKLEFCSTLLDGAR